MKNNSWITLAIVVFGAIVFFMWGSGQYNGLVRSEENVNSAWSKVESAYQRRADLIGNLVNTVKGYADFEQETLTQVIEARSKATSVNIDANNLNAAGIQQFQQAQQGLSSALSRLLVTVERYPDLKANQSFLQLQDQLEGTENRIKVERDRFNDAVENHNLVVRSFPRNIIAGVMGFDQKGYFEADQGASKAPVVEF